MNLLDLLLFFGLAMASVLLLKRQYRTAKALSQTRRDFFYLLREKKIVFEFLHDLGEAFTENIDRPHLLKIILLCAENICEARGGAIYLWDEKKKNLKTEAIMGIFPPPFLLPDSIVAKVVRRERALDLSPEPAEFNNEENLLVSTSENETQTLPQAQSLDNSLKVREEPLYTKNYLEIPLKYRAENLGVIALANRKDGADFTADDFEVVKSIADQAAFALHNVQVYHQLSDKKKMDHDLKVARQIQRILLPSQPPHLAEYEFCALNLPALQVSGDYYDFIEVDEFSRGMVIADVSGKGIPASLIMAMCRSVFRSVAKNCIFPAQVLREVNRQLYPDMLDDMFITMVYLIINVKTHELRIARAGHEKPLLCTHHFHEVESIECPGIALGIDSGPVFDELIEDVSFVMQPDDTLMLYTDGINEAIDQEGEEFGREHLKEALLADGQRGVNFLVKEVLEKVQRFSTGHPQNDDITLAALQRRSVKEKRVKETISENITSG